ncbi:MAG: hypothetical protein LC775_12685 [Acidobacteria bacterium]|nr:hypothetical protein [Acidobacteriota bacterium]
MDKFVADKLLPQYNHGEKRATNHDYNVIAGKYKRLKRLGWYEEARLIKKQKDALPSVMPNDPNYRRLQYIRYADGTPVQASNL